MRTARVVCRECRERRTVELKGESTIGRPIWECPEGHTQAGPFSGSVEIAADGGPDE